MVKDILGSTAVVLELEMTSEVDFFFKMFDIAGDG